MPKAFLRRDTKRFGKIGKNRPKLQRWRKPRGRDNKMREKRKGYHVVVSIGYKKSSAERQKQQVVATLRELEKVDTQQPVVLSGRVGAKKKLVLMKAATERGVMFVNVLSEGGKKK